MSSSSTPTTPPLDESLPASSSSSPAELFQIVDESGEGFGFELTPQALARPLAIGTASLFAVGMLAGIPVGIAMGRSDETRGSASSSNKRAARPTLGGVKFAASAFGLGTLLCASMGVAAVYAVRTYYAVDTFDEFGRVMRQAVPARRKEMEENLSPLLDKVRKNASDNLPGPVQRLQQQYSDSRLGRWLRRQVDSSLTIVSDDPVLDDSSHSSLDREEHQHHQSNTSQ